MTLDSLARLRPTAQQQLRLVSGMSQAAMELFGEPMVKVGFWGGAVVKVGFTFTKGRGSR